MSMDFVHPIYLYHVRIRKCRTRKELLSVLYDACDDSSVDFESFHELLDFSLAFLPFLCE